MQQHDSGNIAPDRPKILVLGATGGTGRLIVGQALARGYDVAALVRSPDAARHLGGARLIVGDARDETIMRCAAATPSSAHWAHRPARAARSHCSPPRRGRW